MGYGWWLVAHEAILKDAVADDGVLAATFLLLLFALHLYFKVCLCTWDGWTVASHDDGGFGFPTTAACCFADDA